MPVPRRRFMQQSTALSAASLAASAGLIPAAAKAQDWNKAAFETKTLADAARALGSGAPIESKDIVIRAPDIAENGAVVPFEVTSKLAKTESVAVLVDKNPNILAANFTIPEGTEPFVVTRVKMGQTSNVHALVKADGKLYFATKEVKVTLGGCGG